MKKLLLTATAALCGLSSAWGQPHLVAGITTAGKFTVGRVGISNTSTTAVDADLEVTRDATIQADLCERLCAVEAPGCIYKAGAYRLVT